MSHDRARLSALVDGELDHEARDRVLAHLAQCDECRAVVETERRVKALLSGMPEASPGGDFLARLNSLGDPNATPAVEPPAPPARRRLPGRGRVGSGKRSGATQPVPPAAHVPQTSQSGQPNPGTLGAPADSRRSSPRTGRQRRGALRLRMPATGALLADGRVAGEPGADESGADELGAAVRAPGGFPLGALPIRGTGADAPAARGSQPDELSPEGLGTGELTAGELVAGWAQRAGQNADELGAGEPATAPARAGDAARRAGGPFGGPSRPAAANRPFGYPDLHGTRRPGQPRPGRMRSRLGSSRLGRRFTVGVAGAASLAGMALVTAFTVGGGGGPTTADVKVVPPIQRYTIQHADSAVNLPYSDPGAATATIGDSNLTGLLSTNR